MAIICVALFGFLKWWTSEAHRKYQASLKMPDYSGQAYAEINGNMPFLMKRIRLRGVSRTTVNWTASGDVVWLMPMLVEN